MRRWMRASTVGLALLTAASVSACGGDSGSSSSGGSGGSSPTKVKVGVIPIVDVAPIYLGKQQGFFRDENIDLTLETGQGGAAIVPGVASGQFQFGFSNIISLLLAQQRGLGIKVVAAGDSTTGKVDGDFGAVVVPKGSGITSAKDLAGKKVAVNTLNNIGSVTINKVVSDDGGDPASVKYVELGFPDMPGALAKGQVDAAWVVEPFLTVARQQGGTAVAWNFAATDPNLMIATYFTSAKAAQSNPDLVKRFSAAMTKSLEYAEKNPDAVRKVLTTYTDIDEATVAKLTLPRFPSAVAASSFQLLADLAVQQGVLESKPDIAAMLP